MLREIIWFLKYRVGRTVCNPWTRWQTAPGATRAPVPGTAPLPKGRERARRGAGHEAKGRSHPPLLKAQLLCRLWPSETLSGAIWSFREKMIRKENSLYCNSLYRNSLHSQICWNINESCDGRWPFPNKNVQDTLSIKPLTSSHVPVIEQKNSNSNKYSYTTTKACIFPNS